MATGWEFTDGASDEVRMIRRIPHWLDRTETPQIQIGWSSDTPDPGDDSKQVVWKGEYLWCKRHEDTRNTTPDGTLTVTASMSTVAGGLTISSLTGMIAPDSDDQLIVLKLTRLGADGDDDLGDDCVLVGCGLRGVMNKLGVAL